MPAADFRAWMERHDLTRDAAAEALGLSRRTIGYYLSGEQPVPKTVMLATEGYDGRLGGQPCRECHVTVATGGV
ncbi:MAG TPA: helix-turn-helix transcriptional regulator [Allosphingosinicella sp.]|nr:helix-turn-helix transcriptional regulator [Allosphingosinicella sp.]